MNDGAGPLLLVEADEPSQQLRALAGGRAAVFSSKAPDKDGPNEDGAALLPVDARRAVLAVADGMGGRPGGESAAALALECLAEALAGVAGDEASLRAAILDGVERANRRILELGIGAATTLAVAEVFEDTLRPYHVGDSGILVVGQRGRFKLETLMHSPVGYAVGAGLLDEDEAMHHEERHLVDNVVGANDMRIEVGSAIRLAPRDTVLLATDGVLDNLGAREIADSIRTGSLREASERLSRSCAGRMIEPVAGQPSKPDDCTFVLYRPTGSTRGSTRDGGR